MNKLTPTLRLESSGKQPDRYGMERDFTEVLCDIDNQHLSKSMMGAALRALADEIDPARGERVPF
jgi:hypothetical protein